MEIIFGISPFVDYNDDDTDYAILRDKIALFLDTGFSGYAVLADDIEFHPGVVVDGLLGQMHVAVTNRLYADLPAARVQHCPTVYSDERMNNWEGGRDYLLAHAALHEDIEILWTGPRTGNREIEAADMDTFEEVTGRRPLIWENYWANDGGDGFFGYFLLEAYTGRAADLRDGVRGIAQNLSIQGASSRLTLATFAEWLDRPTATRADQVARAIANERSFSFVVGRDDDADAATLALFLEAFDGNPHDETPHFHRLELEVHALTSALAADAQLSELWAVLHPLQSTFARMVTLQSELHHSGLEPDLVDDFWWPARRLVFDGRAGLLLLTALGRRRAGETGDEALAAAREALKAASASRFVVSLQTVPSLRTAVEGMSPRDDGYAPLVFATDPPHDCRAGEPWRYRPFDEEALVTVTGLPGALIVDGEIEWTPPRGGRYHAAIAGITTQEATLGMGTRELHLNCGIAP